MTSESKETSKKYQLALDCAEQGQYAEALDSIQSYLDETPDDAEALNDAGTILWCQGLSNDALTYLQKARQVAVDSPEILRNLFETYLSLGLGKDAASLFDELERTKILHVDMLNRTATILIDAGDLSEALSALKRSLALEPGQKILEPIVDVVRYKMEAQQQSVV